MPRYGQVDHDYAMRLAGGAVDDDGPVYMLNLMAYREQADYGAEGETGVSGREADDRYAPLDVLAEIGANVCLVADVVDAHEPWDRVAVVRYPTRRSFIEMQGRKDFQERHVHKEAGMARTIVMGTLPIGGLPADDDGLLLLEVWSGAESPSPATDGVCFDVEGTIVGDGREWAGVRYTPVDDSARLPEPREDRQALLLRTRLLRWS